MATYATAANQVAALKELYTGDDYMKDLVYRKNPFLALVPKDESPSGFAGKYIPVPLIYGSNQGRSATFSTAQTNQTPAQLASFFVYRVSNYSIATITNELLEATVSDAGAFLDEGKLQVDTAIRSISNDLAGDLFRSGTGSRGQIGSISGTSTVTIVLQNTQDITQFEVNMTLVGTATDGGSPTGSPDTLLVTSINRSTGTLVGTATGSPGTNWAAGYFLVVQGDIPSTGATSTSSYLKVTGLSGWLPYGGPSAADSFWGVNRSTDATRLAGVSFNGSAESIEEALIDASSLVAREGGEPDMCFMNFASWAALEKELGAKVQYVQVKHDTADIAFKGITVNAPYGPITVMADRSCPQQRAFLLEMNTWKLRSLGKSPHILTYGREGLEGIRVGNADALEVRTGYYGNLICSAPGFNAVVSLSA